MARLPACPRVMCSRCFSDSTLARLELPFQGRHFHSSAFSAPCAVAAPQNGISTCSTRRQEKRLCGKGRSLHSSHCKLERGVRGDRCLHMYGMLYCEFVMKKLWSFVGAL